MIHKISMKSLVNRYSIDENDLFEAEYQGRKVKLNKPMRGDVKKFKVYVKNEKGNVTKVNFGHGGTSAKKKGEKTMKIKKSIRKTQKFVQDTTVITYPRQKSIGHVKRGNNK